VNFAHGAFYALGAFAALLGLQWFGINYWAALVLAPLVVGLFGGRLIFASKSDGRNTHYFPGVFDTACVSCGFHYRSCYP
jgi:hypothetical protein